jgi:streptomycin 6-kinase
VLKDGAPAMLKVASGDEERNGAALMEWWAGEGAAGVLVRQDHALLMERVIGQRSLAAMAQNGEDDRATVILCDTAAALHASRNKPPPGSLVPLDIWFRALWPRATSDGGIFERASATARALLTAAQDTVVLHGDYHHDNVLDGGKRGWLAIDPKGLVGERTFEFANLLRNPTLEIALAPGRMRQRVGLIARSARLDPAALLRWLFAYACLSAAWNLEEGDPTNDLAIAAMAEAELGNA